MAEKPLRIRVVAPARWAPDEALSAFEALMATEGFAVEVDARARAQFHQLAGEDTERAASLREAVADPDVDIIWCARGGYGAARTLPLLSDCSVSGPKVLIGYSDMTALELGEVLPGVIHIHGPMPIDITKPGGAERLIEAARQARAVLLGAPSSPRSYSLEAVVPGEASAPIAVGNLCVLMTLIGTPFEPRWDRVILCVEDICEYLYALDRHFVHLAQSRLGPAIAGLVLGDFTDLEDNEIPWGEDVAAMARRHFPGVPIAAGLPLGHADRNEAFVQGAAATLTVVDGQARLTINPHP